MQKQTKKTIHDIFASYFEDPLIQRVAHTVSKKLEEGHICLDLKQYNKNKKEGFNINKLKSSPYLTNDPDINLQPFVLHKNKIYLQRYFHYESNILNRVHDLVKSSVLNREKQVELLLNSIDFINSIFENKADKHLDKDLMVPWQMIAVFSSILNNFSIITGGPGTGKTTTIAKLLALLFKINQNTTVALAAPTGKAAARLNESLINGSKNIKNLPEVIKTKFSELKAQTIHRLLGFKFNSTEFKHNKDNPLKYDIIIIDESSMIDVAMMSKLLESTPLTSKLILLGDKDQLSSIEAGSIFGDLCKTQSQINNLNKEDINFFNGFITNDELKIPESHTSINKNILTGSIIELRKSYRFKNDEGIGKFSNLVINGIYDSIQLIEPFKSCNNSKQCVKITNNYEDPAFYTLLNQYEAYIKENDIQIALQKLDQFKVLCAVKKGKHGVIQYNNIIETHLKSKGLIQPKNGFYHNQIIMITSNDYSLGLFNGDIGIVRKDNNTKQLCIYFQNDSKVIDFPTSSINSYEPVFAMTIHKSQGSEFKNIAIIIPQNEENKLLSRELIYTAVTRAKNNVLILTDHEVLSSSVSLKTQRVSGIIERVKDS